MKTDPVGTQDFELLTRNGFHQDVRDHHLAWTVLEFDFLFLDVVAHKMELGADMFGSFVLARILRDGNCALVVTMDNDCSLREAKFFQQFGVPQ